MLANLKTTDAAPWLKDVGIPLLTFLLGLLVRFTLSKKEKLEMKHACQKRAEEMGAAINKAFEEFTRSLAQYSNSLSADPTPADFVSIAISGEAYFMRLKLAVEAAFEETVSPTFVSSSLIPAVKDAQEKLIPKFYALLNDIQKKRGFRYEDYRRENYDLLVSFYEKHCLDGASPFPTKGKKKAKG